MQTQIKHQEVLDTTPLCVDLDKTLLRTDSLAELCLIILKANPFAIFLLFYWMTKGRAAFKAMVASRASLDPEHLPYNKDLYFYLKRMAKRGRPIILVTGADQRIAHSIADHLELFTEVIASDGHNNITGRRKAAELVSRFGEKQFDYIGDATVDLEVWATARNAIVVTSDRSLARKAQQVANVDRVIFTPVPIVRLTASAIRVHQWVKNLLIFLPLFLAHRYDRLENVAISFTGFLAFSFMASAIYVFNDLLDLSSDREHVDKRNRPYAAGALPIESALILIPVLLLGAFICAYKLPPDFAWLLLAYMGVTTWYTFQLKKVPIADILTLSSLFSFRLIGGSILTGVSLSPWFIAFSGFFFLSLASLKRCSELILLQSLGKSESAGRGYQVKDLPVMIAMGLAAGYGSVVVLALYINSEIARLMYRDERYLWLLCPLLIFWISRTWFLANRSEVCSDPVKFAIKDKVSYVVAFMALIIWMAARGNISFLN